MTGHRTRPALLAAAWGCFLLLRAQEPAGTRPALPVLAPDPSRPILWTGSGPGEGALISLDFHPPVPTADATAVARPTGPGWHLLAHLPRTGTPGLHLLETDPMPGNAIGERGTSRDGAIETGSGTAWDGFVPAAGSRWFRLRLQPEETRRIETLAARAGSRLDPVIRVLGPDGGELAEVDDVPGWLSDAVVDLRATQSGDHWVEIRDTRHEGGPDHWFRLHIRDSPRAPSPWRLPSEPHPGDENPPAPAGLVLPGAAVDGWFDVPGRTNRHRIDGRQGLALSVAFSSRTLGWFADPVARLESDDGDILAAIDPAGHHGGGLLTHRFREDGTAWLVVWEASGLGGPEFGYRMHAAPTDRTLEIEAEPAILTLGPGDTAEIKVRITRRRHDLPVHLEIRGLPPGFRLADPEIPAGKREHTARLELRGHPPGPGIWPVELVGVAVDAGGKDGVGRLEAIADTVGAWRRVWPGLLHPPTPLPRRIVVVSRPEAQERP